MIKKPSSLHWGLIFPQGFLGSWTGNVLQKKKKTISTQPCRSVQLQKNVQLQQLQHSSVTYKNGQNWCKREKCSPRSHKETAHSVPEWLCGPCWAEFPWIFLYVVEFNLQPAQCYLNSMGATANPNSLSFPPLPLSHPAHKTLKRVSRQI